TFHPDGHLAIARAVESMGVHQMVPVAASYTLEEIAQQSPAASSFQMTIAADVQLNVDMAQRAKDAGYRYIIAAFSPIRQWRERLIENRFTSRGSRGQVNYGPELSDPAGLQELIDFTEPRWTWSEVRQFIVRSPLPVIVKGIESAADAIEAVKAGAVGLYVSNYGDRDLDRSLSTIEVLPEVRAAVGADMSIVLDSGIRRGSDIAAAIALGADAVAIGRVTALGLAADGEEGVRSALQILREEFWQTLGHLGCSRVEELGPHVFRKTF
ncbi:alpha-hydroxy acid oxidase, partial [Microbacterium sp. YY-01]|uniref:alpha-hydroxy acid oxidase n=1 Tax=Microbacterium sp. YY-01 TaxID=3421634 RepID=UPI003D17200E